MEKQRRPIFQPNELSDSAVVSMRTRIISAIVGIVVVLPFIIFGDWPFFGLIVAVLVLAIIEIIRCAKTKYSKVLYIVAFLLAFMVLLWNIIQDIHAMDNTWRIFDSYNRLSVSITIMFIGICLSAMTILIDKNFTIIDACFIFTTVFLIAFGFQCALFLRYFPITDAHVIGKPYFNGYVNAESCLLLLFVAIGACLNDAFAYFVGVFFGKNKMNVRLSPKKTWEGFFGGVFLTAIALTGMALGLSAGGHPVLAGVIDLDHWYHVVVLSFLIPLVATAGDLFFSAIKRHYEIKDFSNIMPGHGGILDRCDSILFSVITVAIYVCIFANQGGGIHLP